MDRQNIRKGRIRYIIGLASLMIAVFVTIGALFVYTLPSNAEGGESSGKEIVIESVENIPAGDIEEQPVPLAARPDTSKGVEMRHAVMMLILLMGTAAYTVYFIRYEKKLVVLRRRAAEAEAEAMKRRRNGLQVREVQK